LPSLTKIELSIGADCSLREPFQQALGKKHGALAKFLSTSYYSTEYVQLHAFKWMAYTA